MASSAPASSESVMNRLAPAPSAGAERPVRAQVGAQYPSALVRALTTPAAFFATNWAAILAILTVVGLGPALVAATRTTTDLRSHADRAFRETLRASAVLVRRDWVLSFALWALLLLIAGNALILTDLAAGGTRVFLVGISLPPTWLAVSYLSAYVVAAAASDLGTSRGAVSRRALTLVMSRPLRALLAPVVIIGVAPLWLLAPLTIAIGFSLPPFFVARFWGRLDDGVPA